MSRIFLAVDLPGPDNLLYFSVLFKMIKSLPRYLLDKLEFQSSKPKLKQRHYLEKKWWKLEENVC